MNVKGYVDSEDGVLLLGDAALLQSWHGTSEESDIAHAIENALQQGLNGLTVNLDSQVSIAWDIGGPGTVDVYTAPVGGLILLRSWFHDEYIEDEVDALALLPVKEGSVIGDFTVNSGYLALLWPGEDGQCIQRTPNNEFYLDKENLMTETSGLIISVANGIYRCVHDEVSSAIVQARRCHIFRVPNKNGD